MGEDEEDHSVPFTLALIAGGIAGSTVDIALYPLDSLKTRLQSPKGFWAAGGFTGIYRGVLATALGASPGSAMFFSACEHAHYSHEVRAVSHATDHAMRLLPRASCRRGH